MCVFYPFGLAPSFFHCAFPEMGHHRPIFELVAELGVPANLVGMSGGEVCGEQGFVRFSVLGAENP